MSVQVSRKLSLCFIPGKKSLHESMINAEIPLSRDVNPDK